jgi:hypothetical protein
MSQERFAQAEMPFKYAGKENIYYMDVNVCDDEKEPATIGSFFSAGSFTDRHVN